MSTPHTPLAAGCGQFDEPIAVLAARFGDRLATSQALRELHGRGESHHPPEPPDAVLMARSTEDVADAVGICAAHRMPVIAFGAGTSLEGHLAARSGGLSIDLTEMSRILRVSAEDLDCTVEAGVTRKSLNAHLRHAGLFFPIDPGADATIGGMAATRASGTNAVRYGTMRENVLGLKAVLPDGRVTVTARRARKSSAGYDLTRLLIGSEGTLGVITEVTLRLHGIPEAVAVATCPFPTIADAVNAVIAVIQCGVPIARIELLDEAQVAACNGYSHTNLPIAPTLFLEFHGTAASVEEQAGVVAAIAQEHRVGAFEWSSLPEARTKLWTARHNAYYAALALRPGSRGWVTDVCVPISRLAECIVDTKGDLDGAPMPVTLVGHVGDGNFHLIFALDPNDPAELAYASRLNERLVARALAMDGTCTGEHGVGLGKMSCLLQEHDVAGLDAMRAIKRAIDPLNIMNPGKIVRLD